MCRTLPLDFPEIYLGAVYSGLQDAAAKYGMSEEGKVRILADLHHAEAKGNEGLAQALRRGLLGAAQSAEREEDVQRAISAARLAAEH